MAGQQALLNFLNAPPPGPKPSKNQPAPLTPQAMARLSPNVQQAVQGALAANAQVQQQQAQHAVQQANFRQAAANRRVVQQELNRQGAASQRFEQQAIKTGTGTLAEGVQGVSQRASAVADRVTAWADSVPTPGGIGLILLAIFFLLWAVVPVNGGNTRLQLLWLTLTGRTKMAPTPEAGGTFNAQSQSPGFGGSGGGYQSANGHDTSSVSALINSLPIRDFGSNV